MADYRVEFPDYDAELIIPAGFKDCSYHNDIMPHVEKRVVNGDVEVIVRIWEDYINPDKREYEDKGNYIFQVLVGEHPIMDYPTNDWEDIRKAIKMLNFYEWEE